MKRLWITLLILLLAALACNLPTGQTQDAALTAAAQTVAVQLTNSAQTQAAGNTGGSLTNTPGSAPDTQTVTPTPPPSSTPQPATSTPLPCNQASFVTDVTIPDDTKIMTGQSFTKTWRFKNTGTCNWTSAYQLVFDHGDQMNGPVSQPLTSGTVPPGATVDVSVALTAPSGHGSYQGFWRFRDASNVLFGLSTGSFWVKIKAVDPTPTPTLPPAVIAVTVDVPLVAGESGSVRSDGSTLTYPNVGDLANNTGAQGFLSFDMSVIPSTAHILAVKTNFADYDTLGNPFGALGSLRMYLQNYGVMDPGDYTGGSPLGAVMRWSNAGDLSSTAGTPDPSILADFQSAVGNSRIQFRVEFNEHVTNSDSVADMVRLGTGIKFIVTYASP